MSTHTDVDPGMRVLCDERTSFDESHGLSNSRRLFGRTGNGRVLQVNRDSSKRGARCFHVPRVSHI